MTQYVLHPDCRVRKEGFGLLFYDLRGPKLLFAETGDVLAPEVFVTGRGLGAALAGRPARERARIARFLRSLVEKGFLREQPLC